LKSEQLSFSGGNMKYILENPTFQEKEIEIDNPKAIELIESYLNRPIGVNLGDLIILSIENVVVKLMLTSRTEEECRFKQVPNKYY
jgi:hypothetical protein